MDWQFPDPIPLPPFPPPARLHLAGGGNVRTDRHHGVRALEPVAAVLEIGLEPVPHRSETELAQARHLGGESVLV